ncbi:MAG: NUDIX hydrolase, partial [Faecalimonas sp.]|nr:NUDIX hydrolase [Faecalimonas sp.]
VVRELEEEAGYLAGKVEHLVDIHSLVAFTNEKTQIFVAWDLTEAEQHLDAEESIELVEYEITELRDMVFAGKIEDAKTVAAILAYLVKYGDEA